MYISSDRVAHNEQIFVIAAKRLHQPVLQLIDILKFVDHDIFEPFLPLEPYVFVGTENIKRQFDEVVIIESEALFLLI
jgi:hypothetical protein